MIAKPSAQRRPMHVLVVESESLVRVLIAEELRQAGVAVVEARHPAEASAYLQADRPVDLVFMDVSLPTLERSLQVARHLRQTYPGLALILTSANPGPQELAELGTFVPKPYSVGGMVARILEALPQEGGERHG